MSASDFKRLAFDGCFFAYTFGLFFFGGATILQWTGFSADVLDKDFAVLHMWLFAEIAAAFFITGVFLSHRMHKRRHSTLGDFLFATGAHKQELTDRPLLASFWGWHLTAVFLLTLMVSFQVTEFSFNDLFDQNGLAGAARLFHDLARVNWDLLPISIVEIFETIFIAFLGTVVAVPLAFVLSFACAKNLMTNPAAFSIYSILRLFLNVTRSIEPLIWAIIFTVWVGVGPFAGMLALLIHSIASLTKQYSEIVEDVSEGPIEGIRSTGANSLQVIWYGVVPQVVMPYIAFTIYRWDINVRMATVIGLVGGGGIGTLLIKYQGQGMWREVGCIILVIAVVVWLMDTASAYIREALK